MSFERLLWRALVQNKVRLATSVAAVACVFGASVLAPGGSRLDARSGYLLLLILPLICASCSLGWNERRARSRVLFRVGFSQEQLATLLALEGVAIGALGAALGSVAIVATWLAQAGEASYGSHSGLWIMAHELSFTFCAALVLSALAAVGPAYRFARSRFDTDAPG